MERNPARPAKRDWMRDNIMNNIRISACIPTYNRADYLKCAIQSLLNQSQAVDEIVVVDDGSTDNTEQTVEQFRCPERVKYYKFQRDTEKPRQLTMVNTFNHCVDKASHEFVSIIGDDDLVSQDWCAVVKKAITAAEAANVFYFSYSIIDEHDRVRRVWPQVYHDKLLSGAEIFKKTTMVFGVSGSLVFKKGFFVSLGRYSQEDATFFDKDLYIRLGLSNASVYFSPKNIFFCRAHQQQTSNVILHGAKEESQRINNFYENSRHICKINDRYRDFFMKNDQGFRYFINKNYLGLFSTFFINSIFFKEISFLYIQGIYKALRFKQRPIYETNCAIMQQYFPQSRPVMTKLFLIAYFIRYWICFINITGRILSVRHLRLS